jgi:hypothetical protein
MKERKLINRYNYPGPAFGTYWTCSPPKGCPPFPEGSPMYGLYREKVPVKKPQIPSMPSGPGTAGWKMGPKMKGYVRRSLKRDFPELWEKMMQEQVRKMYKKKQKKVKVKPRKVKRKI